MAEPKKMAILQLDPLTLRQLLQLPDEVDIIRAETLHGYRNVIEIVVEGAGWPTNEGFPIKEARGYGTQEYYNPADFPPGSVIPGAIKIDWGFPK